MHDLNKLLVALGYMCDSLKRLEKAIEAQNMDDRQEYLAEARDRRERVERDLETLINPKGNEHA